jgi:hypothetical protein
VVLAALIALIVGLLVSSHLGSDVLDWLDSAWRQSQDWLHRLSDRRG